jgi:beta-glucosidase
MEKSASSNAASKRRRLPDKLLVSYTTQCSEKVIQSVRSGVNVVVWAFCEMIAQDQDEEELPKITKRAKCISRFDRECAKTVISQLDSEGYDDTIHLVSFGGWNGPHLPDELDVEEMYAAFKEHCGDIFHGLDWDLEGHDQLDSPTNHFSVRCLENMGRFSQLAKNDGYIVGIAPPQSYLDIQSGEFSRFVNLTDASRGWHDDFHYFGRNVYSYLLAKYGDSIDFVSIQFYESYSDAGMEIFHHKMSQAAYLQFYVKDLVVNKKESYFVNFDQDPTLNYPRSKCFFPRSKLVWGFANGWGADDNEKVCYFEPEQISIAYNNLDDSQLAPRGFMYWVV